MLIARLVFYGIVCADLKLNEDISLSACNVLDLAFDYLSFKGCITP